jgi:hypothetical protein
LLIIRTRAVQAAIKKAVNPKKILNLIGAKKKVKVLMMEEKQNKRKSKRKRRLNKQGSPNKKRF